MSGLESIIATGEDRLAGPIDYQIGQDQASYIVSRESQTFFANQNVVTPTSVRTLKFQIGGMVFWICLLSFSRLHCARLAEFQLCSH